MPFEQVDAPFILMNQQKHKQKKMLATKLQYFKHARNQIQIFPWEDQSSLRKDTEALETLLRIEVIKDIEHENLC